MASEIKSLSRNLPSPWIENDEFDWNCITKDAILAFIRKNTIIYYQDDIVDYVYLVKRGRVCLSALSSCGKEKSFFIAEKGCLFGELSAIDNNPNSCTAVAVTDSYIYQIPKDVFISELQSNNELCFKILKLLVKKSRLIMTQIKQLSFNDSIYKVYYALIHLINQYSSPSSKNYKLTIKFTHQEMANLTGLSRVRVSQILSDLISDGIIEKKDGYLIVKDLEPIINYVLEKD